MAKKINNSLIFPEQCRAARALLNWTQDQLVGISKVSKPTIVAFENKQKTTYERTIEHLRRIFEKNNIIFSQNNEGCGVFLKNE